MGLSAGGSIVHTCQKWHSESLSTAYFTDHTTEVVLSGPQLGAPHSLSSEGPT